MRSLSFNVRIFLWLSLAMTSGVMAQVDLIKQQTEINSAKADLEEARKERDKVVAERWQDRQRSNEEREKKSEQIREAKDRVELLSAERARLFEEMRALREDLARVKAEAEKSRSDFLLLSSQQDRLDALTRQIDLGTPFNVPERLQSMNKIRKNMEVYRDDPGRVAAELLQEAVNQLRFTRTVTWEEGDLVFPGGLTVRGQRVRLGAVGAAQWEGASQKSALMLAAAGDKGRIYAWQDKLSLEIQQKLAQAFFESKDSAMVLIPVDVLLSTSLTSEMASQTEQSWSDKAKQFFRNGGVLMYPIVALFVMAMLFALERVVVVAIKGMYSKKLLREIESLCKTGDLESARQKASQMKGALGQVVQAVLRHPAGGRVAAEKALEEVFATQVPMLEKRLNVISVFGASAPLLGLLGTVMGMIQLFDVITLYGTADPKLLAGGISVALVTTEAGLFVAIPVQLVHTWVANRVESLVARMESTALRLLNILWIKG